MFPQENHEMNNKELTAIFQAVGKRYGFDESTAEFSPFKDFKMKWTRTYKWISFEVCDYLSDAPEDVMKSLATTIFRKIGGEADVEYGKEFTDWIGTGDFIRLKQPLYVRRFRGLSVNSAGANRNLGDSYERLVSKGLVDYDNTVYLGWATFPSSKVVGKSSVIMKVVAMSDILDSLDIPDDVMDYCLYSQLAHIGMGFNPGHDSRGAQYDELLSKFPGRSEMESFLERINMHV